MIYPNCQDHITNIKINNNGLKEKCLKQKDYGTIFYLQGNSTTAHFVPLFNKIGVNLYYSHKSLDYFSYDDLNNLSKKYHKVIYTTEINNIKKLDFIMKDFNKLNDNIEFLFFNSTPFAENNNQPRNCLIKAKTCFVEKKEDMQQRGLEQLNQQLISIAQKNKRVKIFDSYSALCPNKKCYIYDVDINFLMLRDQVHLTSEGSLRLAEDFIFFINKKYK